MEVTNILGLLDKLSLYHDMLPTGDVILANLSSILC